jgi:membrane associated rhomboid family serine protease
MILPVNFFFLAVLLILAIRYRRDPSRRAAFLAVLRDQKAMTFGVLWVIFALAINFASHGFHDILNVVLQALISGFAVAAILNWFYKRKRASST